VQETAKEYFSRNPSPSTEAVWAAIMACRAAGHVHAWGEAVTWAERGQAMDPDSPEALGWLHFLLGTASMYTGNVYVARRELDAFHPIAAVCPSLQRLIADCRFNQGFLMRFFDESAAEVGFFRQASELHRGRGRLRQALQCMVEIGWSYLSNGRPELALQILESIATEIVHQGDQELEIDVQLQWALYHRSRGALDTSMHICESLSERADLIERQTADLRWIKADNALSLGMLDEALRLVDAAYASALNDWWPLQIHRIEQLRDSIQSRSGR
jgi:tetratricopeptide (TPR) repeat protein